MVKVYPEPPTYLDLYTIPLFGYLILYIEGTRHKVRYPKKGRV